MNLPAVSPICFNEKKRSISFGELKFELDKPTKEYLLQLSRKENLSSQDVLEIAVSSDFAVKGLTNKANAIAKELVQKQSFLKGKKLEEIWPEQTFVKVGLRPKRSSSDKMILNAYFNNDHFAEENIENADNPKGSDRKEINTFAFWDFLGELKEQEALTFFVEKMLKKQPNYNSLKNNAELVQKSEEERSEDEAKKKLRNWVDR